MTDDERAEKIAAALLKHDDSEPDIEILRDVQIGHDDPSDDRIYFWFRDYALNTFGQRLGEVDEVQDAAKKLAEIFEDESIASSPGILRGYFDFQVGTLREAVILRDILNRLIESSGSRFDADMYPSDDSLTDD